MSLLASFEARALLAGLGIAVAAGPLGCFVVWRRMAYFGDATAHAAVLGVALALAVELPVLPGVLLAAVATALAVAAMTRTGRLAEDAALGVTSSAALAAGLLLFDATSSRALDLEALLLGDILTVSKADVGVVWGAAAGICGYLAWRWSALLAETLGPELAAASGIDASRERLGLMLALALLVAVAIQLVGALLVTALLVVPAAAARRLAATPEAMAVAATGLAALATAGGIAAALRLDLQVGPAIVVAAALLFALTSVVRR